MSTKADPTAVAKGCLTTLTSVVLRSLYGGWALMITLGVVHHDIYPAVGAPGYWPCVVLAWAFAVVSALAFGRGLPMKEGIR